MPKNARERLAQLLSGTEPTTSDSAMLRLPGNVLELDVADVGPVQSPIRAPQAKRLVAAARPAAYGRGEQTLSDTSVRDTWEITPERVGLGGPAWQSHLDAALEHFREELGLPVGARLTAELHSLLVYGKGQFFLPHQDSEKHGGMVATLVAMLPSVHTGGELVVDDAGTERVYGGSREDLVLVAFYADRRHEVRPVRSGYRVSLTFNLLLASSGTASADGSAAAQAASWLTEHFATSAISKYGSRDLGEPRRLAFLLDHEYTQGGLTAGLLKGADAEWVATLLAAAEQAGCETMLALAEIKETWDVIPDDDYSENGWYDEDEAEDDEDSGPADDSFHLNELIDDEMTLGWWIGTDGSGAETIRLPLDDYEVAMVTPTGSITPYQTEYEGYMGNYGNTLDRWYRRAAVVMWPRKKAFAARAEAGSAWAMRRLLERINAGELAGARADAASLEPFWTNVGPDVLAPALHAAAGLDDGVSARVVAAPFRLEMLTAHHGPLLATLARAYGDVWVLHLIDSWQAPNRSVGQDTLTWAAGTMLPLCQSLRREKAGAIADGLADLAWRFLWDRIEWGTGQKHPGRRQTILAGLAEPLARVLEAASDRLGGAMAQSLLSLGEHAVELDVPTLRALQLPPTPAAQSIVNDVRRRLLRFAGLPPRAQGDWSISWAGCGCALCDRLAKFLADPSERSHEWPLATPGRQHIHQQIEGSGLPVLHSTRRQGRPYTLLLEKTEELFRREEEARQHIQADLAWLAAEFD